MSADVPGEVTFVLCIENNGIRNQALLLCESIRRWTGRHRDAAIVAVSPRPGLGIDVDARRRLDTMGVSYVEAPLNRICLEYGSANRVFAAAWAEAHARSEWIVVLDSDTVFLGEPVLPEGADVGVRPVDTKGSATTGPGDAFEEYWHSLAALGGIALEALPLVNTTDGLHKVRASYNGGLVVVRRSLGILQAWAELFSQSVSAGLKPWRGSRLNVRASTGYVGVEASEYWGSNQAAAALAIWHVTDRVRHYPDTYNVPLHLWLEQPQFRKSPLPGPLVHVHYHWTFTEPHDRLALARMRELGATAHQVDWLRARLPLGPHGVGASL